MGAFRRFIKHKIYLLQPKTELCRLFKKYRSDKCPAILHSYSHDYYEFLKDYKFDFTNIIEIGIGSPELMKIICGEGYQTGASLKAWRDFFPNAYVYGLDINISSIQFQDVRIKCFYTDQSQMRDLDNSVARIREFRNDDELKFDLIIDDGSHIVNHMILSFETLGEYVQPGGFYVIEDIQRRDLPLFEKLQVPGFEVAKVHKGYYYYDDFIIYKKVNK